MIADGGIDDYIAIRLGGIKYIGYGFAFCRIKKPYLFFCISELQIKYIFFFNGIGKLCNQRLFLILCSIGGIEEIDKQEEEFHD